MNPRSLARGFTLIELMVVIAIIGLLTAIVVTQLGAARNKERDGQRLTNIKELSKALELYLADFKSYPTSTALLVPKYIRNLPKDPGGTDYFYQPYTVLGSVGIQAANRCSGSQVCINYQLGADLEDPSNPALKNDRDVSNDLIKGSDAADCSGTVGRFCYDVMP